MKPTSSDSVKRTINRRPGTSPGQGRATGQATLDRVQATLLKAHETRVGRAELPLLDDLSAVVRWGRLAYALLLFLIAWVGVHVAWYAIRYWEWEEATGFEIGEPIDLTLNLIGTGAALILAWVVAFIAKAQFSGTCSELWHKAQHDLKVAMGVTSGDRGPHRSAPPRTSPHGDFRGAGLSH